MKPLPVSEMLAFKQQPTWAQTQCELENLPATYAVEGDNAHILSWFTDRIWILPASLFPNSVTRKAQQFNFDTLPASFQLDIQHLFYRYLHQRVQGLRSPRGNTLALWFASIRHFLRFLAERRITQLTKITPELTMTYAAKTKKMVKRQGKNKGQALSSSTLTKRFIAIEILHNLARNTDYGFAHPWPESSASHLAGNTGGGPQKAKTPFISDENFESLMRGAMTYVDDAKRYLKKHSQIESLRQQEWSRVEYFHKAVNAALKAKGFDESHKAFSHHILDLRTACSIVIIGLTGIRVHELINITNDAYYTRDEGDVIYYWLKSVSSKTYSGAREWMMPEYVIKPLNVLKQLAEPLQLLLQQQIEQAELPSEKLQRQEHHNLLFLAKTMNQHNRVQALSSASVNKQIQSFGKKLGIKWHFSCHQFRRTFAAHVAYHWLGSLRYLKEHFGHWSLDMAALYALNDQQDIELFDEVFIAVQTEQLAWLEHAMEEDTLIAGGVATAIKVFRQSNEAIKTYGSRAEMLKSVSETVHLRATGVAWCTSDCPGGGAMEVTRCGDCDGSLITEKYHGEKWQRIYAQQIELLEIDDIGEGGKARVHRDIVRCRHVLSELGISYTLPKNKKGEGHETL